MKFHVNWGWKFLMLMMWVKDKPIDGEYNYAIK